MRFSRDRRGQSVVVGTVILFGFLIVALGVFQVQVVPTENANVEFEHSQAVEDDFGDLRNDVLRAGSTGSTGSTQIRLGTRYPARTFFINPPPVSGSLSTEPTGSIRVSNATVGDGAHPNAAAFWNTTPTFPTRSLRYDADYNEFDGAPELVYEHSVVAAEFDDAVLLRTGQTVVSDGRISLTALTGSVSESGVAPQSVDPRAVSASDTTVPLEPTGGNVTLELPTAVGNASRLADRWNRALPAGATAAPNATGEAIRITLANGSDPYRLALSEVSLDATGETEPAYVVPVGSESAAVGETVAVEVRDRYNNPVPDATVSFGGENRTTGDGGRALFEVNETGTVVAAINGTGGPTYESVVFDVAAGGAGVGNRFDVEWLENETVQIPPSGRELQILVTDGQSDTRVEDALVDVSYGERSVTGDGPDNFDVSGRTDSNGTTTAFFDPSAANTGDEFYLYATAGDDVDRIVGQIVDSGFNNFGPVSASDLDVNTEAQSQEFQFQLNGSLAAGDTVTIDLDDPQSRTGSGNSFQVDYRGATGSSSANGDVTVTASSESATADFTASSDIPDGTTVTVTLSGVDVGSNGGQNDPYTVVFTRSDSGAATETTFGVN
ncbi:flagellar hook protein FlgE [Halorubrum salinarum]|uniref:hypothetical protein n=1 Tax=Halorubrum salinarum TaxID=2739057 RepID=UPI001F1B1B1C|nr:hypothetical protein [Halorubrum salinarum]